MAVSFFSQLTELGDRQTIADGFRMLFSGPLQPSIADALKSITENKFKRNHHSVQIPFGLLDRRCPLIVRELGMNSNQVIEIGDEMATEALQYYAREQDSFGPVVQDAKLHIRLIDFPHDSVYHRQSLPNDADIYKFCVIKGLVVYQSTWKLLERKREYQCTNCGFSRSMDAARSYGYNLPVSIGKCPVGCKGSKLDFRQPTGIEKSSVSSDFAVQYQEVVIEPQLKDRPPGSLHRQMTLILKDDLVDSCTIGDDVMLAGRTYVRFPSIVKDNRPLLCEYVFEVNSIKVLNMADLRGVAFETTRIELEDFWRQYPTSPLRGRTELTRRFFPDIIGMDMVKLGILLVVVGGEFSNDTIVSTMASAFTDDPSFNPLREKGHLLLVGRPGCGKSQLLLAAVRLIKGSLMMQGSTCSSPGLTAAIQKTGDSNDSAIHPGALILTKNAICAIDEFNTLSTEAANSLHESMEDMKITITKAGHKHEIPVNCSVFGALNPITPSPPDKSNTGLAPSIIGRFDLIFDLSQDAPQTVDTARERQFAEKIMQKIMEEDEAESAMGWPVEKRQDIVTCIRGTEVSVVGVDAVGLLRSYYVHIRQRATRDKDRTGVRLFASLFRLTVCHARLMNRHEATIEDAVSAIGLVEISFGSKKSLTGITYPLQSTEDDPVSLQKKIMIALAANLPDQREMLRQEAMKLTD